MRITLRYVLAPANVITLVGLIITIIGCFKLNTLSGLGLVLIGRSFDLLDGPVARFMNDTRISKFFDPTADKIALTAILLSVLAYGLTPWYIVLYVAFQNVLVAILSVKALKAGKAEGAAISGKLNVFFQTMSILLFIVSHLFTGQFAHFANIAAYASILLSLPLAFRAIFVYSR
ncbi:MAG: CDP-diacylglycerol--glycerol-3-phosphate 3-phosphatidyltransferase [Candidatus Saccharibacteria bacterium]|nr:CDP-diacylglycerol--glycerol-3-phosphate 3-phosphatidyltransferase [Candidatus Saccharibacteria bacterium]